MAPNRTTKDFNLRSMFQNFELKKKQEKLKQKKSLVSIN